jgi:hypothetical protein
MVASGGIIHGATLHTPALAQMSALRTSTMASGMPTSDPAHGAEVRAPLTMRFLVGEEVLQFAVGQAELQIVIERRQATPRRLPLENGFIGGLLYPRPRSQTPVDNHAVPKVIKARITLKLIEESGFVGPLLGPGTTRERSTFAGRPVAKNLVHAVKRSACATHAVEGHDVVHVVEDRTALVALIQLQPAVTPQLFGGVPVMLVTHESRPRSGAEASDFQEVEDADHPSANPRRVIFVLPNAD